jgi:hypothetical protein
VVTLEDVEHNLERAARTLLLLPMTGCAPSGVRALWPEAPSEWSGYGYHAAQTKLPIPSPTEISKMDQVLAWAKPN